MSGAGCAGLGSRKPLRLALEIDSAEYAAYHRAFVHTGRVPFRLKNTTGKPISRAGCGGPGAPAFEKLVNGKWVYGFEVVSLACRTEPDFYFPPGQEYSSIADFYAFDPGHHTMPELRLDSVGGTYRLEWGFAVGYDAMDEKARRVEFTSKPFRLVEYMIYSPLDSGMVRALTDGVAHAMEDRWRDAHGVGIDSFRVVVADSLNPYWRDAKSRILAILRAHLGNGDSSHSAVIGVGIPKSDVSTVSAPLSISFAHRCKSGEWRRTLTQYVVTSRRDKKQWLRAEVTATLSTDPPPCPEDDRQ